VSTVALRPSASATRLGALRAPGRAAVTAAALSLVTAWIHLAYTASHWRDWWAYGMFFLVSGAFQGLFVPAMLRWPRSVLVALTGIAGNFAIVGMYVYSRTIGVPMGPHTGVAERTGAVDLGCTAMEIVLMGVLMAIVGQKTRRGIANALLVVGVLLWVGRLTGRLP
jgi:hypothetical protein